LLKSDVKPEKMIDLHIKLGKATMDKLITLAGIRRETASAVIRQILAAGLDNEIAERSSEALVSVVRKTIRAELKSTENRLAALGAKACIAAGTSERMLATLFERSISGEASEKQRQAKAIHDEARKSAVSGLKQSGGDENA
jgi:hypothetical protein